MNNRARNVVLTGFMGTGKTTVGKLLAERSGRAFVDSDELIAQRAGKPIPAIFADEGEAAFRQMEKALCRELAARADHGLVIATGGGMLVDAENRALLEESGLVICLNAPAEVIEARIGSDSGRPLLSGDWRVLLERRKTAYAAIRAQVDTADKTPEAIAEEILTLLNTATIAVQAPGGGYEIVIQPGLLKNIVQQAARYRLTGRVAVVTNTTLAPLYGAALVAALPNASLVTMPDGESYKTLETVASLYSAFVAAGLDRYSTVIALGGGVVGDTAGFAAATYMRGLPLVQIPTSLLAMVDSSVGGKVGVDLPEGKNLIGAFKQPDAVLIDPEALHTLPAREWRCGLAEAIKHGLLADENLLDPALHHPANALELVRRAIQVKVDVVQADPYEQNIRAHLNLGHTFGHAIEQASGYRWLHGEAVALGLVAALRLSHKLGLCEAALVERVERLLAEAGFRLRLDEKGLDPETLYAAMATDKKWRSGKSRFVLLRGVGQPLIQEGVPAAEVLRVLEELG